MPKFLYTIILLAGTLWWILISTLITKAPESISLVLLVIGLMLFTLALTFSMPLYFYFLKKAPDFTNLRYLYRKAFKFGGIFSLFISGLLGLRAFKIFSLLNVTSFTVLCAMIFLQLRKTR